MLGLQLPTVLSHPVGGWESNLGPMEEKLLLLVAEPPLWPQESYLTAIFLFISAPT